MTEHCTVQSEALPQLTAELGFLPFFNLAFQQNSIPAVQELKLTSHSDRSFAGLVCTFTSSPEMILPKTIHAEEIAPGETLTIRLFGLNTLTAKARQYLEYAVTLFQNSGRI